MLFAWIRLLLYWPTLPTRFMVCDPHPFNIHICHCSTILPPITIGFLLRSVCFYDRFSLMIGLLLRSVFSYDRFSLMIGLLLRSVFSYNRPAFTIDRLLRSVFSYDRSAFTIGF